MYIEKTEQNQVKINFNLAKNQLKLGDLLKISAADISGVIAQVIKIKSVDDNANSSIATAKIHFTIQQDGKLSQWQGNNPAKESNISLLTITEMQAITGITAENDMLLGVLSANQFSEFRTRSSNMSKPTMIIGDKDATKQQLTYLIASELAYNDQKVIIIDENGDYTNIEDALVIKAGKNFKLPLDAQGLDTLYNKSLSGVSAETKANIENIFSEIEEYLLSGEVEFIPFSNFLEAINEEYQANSTPELSFLNNSLKKLYRHGIYADNAKDINYLFNAIDKNNLIIIDLSDVNDQWKADFPEVITRLNKEKYKKNFSLINTVFTVDSAKKILNNCTKSGIAPIFSLMHDSEIIKSLLPKTDNLFVLQAEGATQLPSVESLMPKLGESEVLVCGKITNNIPLFVNINPDIEPENQIIIDQSFMQENATVNAVYSESEVHQYQEHQQYAENETEESAVNELEEEIEYSDELEEENEDDMPYSEPSNQVSNEQTEEEAEYADEMSLLFDDDEPKQVISAEQSEESEGDEDFDYYTSEEFQDESVLDYVQTAETPETSEEDYSYYDENTEDEEELEEEEYSESTQAGYSQQYDHYDSNYQNQNEQYSKKTDEYYQTGNAEFSQNDLNNFMDYDDESVENPQQVTEYSTQQQYEETEDEYYEEEIEEQPAPAPARKGKMPAPSGPAIPVYNVSSQNEHGNDELNDDLSEGDTVKHKKYGIGIIKKVIGYSDRKLCSIQFEDVGRRLLDPKLADLELVSKIK